MWEGQHSGGEPSGTAGERAPTRQALPAQLGALLAAGRASRRPSAFQGPCLPGATKWQGGSQSPLHSSWLDCEVILSTPEDLRATMGEQSSSFKALLINLKAPVGLVFSTL